MADEIQAAPAEGAAAQPQKKKKVNRLAIGDIEKRIADFEGKGQARSVYYKHLLARRSELKPS